ncbi:hypothetical protein [Candidatus Methylocalor cossyra]|uniref:Chromosome partition protein Smc n=1 Tax=Candidatus Methylocalor cossyra TaxID=3108543 RepID=A0ABM9NH40_9GAMM
MVEDDEFPEDAPWETGFEGDRRVVLARLGPFKRLFPRPKHYTRRFYHRVYELAIEDWRIPLEPLRLGALCTVEATVAVRFQPTLKFAREHLDQLDALGAHIKASYQTLLQDAAEQELRRLEMAEDLEGQAVRVERRIENRVHELLALRDIQCRARCTIATRFASPDHLDHPAALEARHQGLYLTLLARRREAAERLAREQYERQLREQRLKLEHEERMLELLKKEADLRRLRQEQETQAVRAELSADEIRYTERIGSEIRLREERIRHEARLRQMELEADLAEKSRRAEALSDVENHLRREIELLALERQRLLLEEEIHDVKVAKAKGWVINAKRRFALGEGDRNQDPEDADIAERP